MPRLQDQGRPAGALFHWRSNGLLQCSARYGTDFRPTGKSLPMME